MLGNCKAPDIMEGMKRLASQGIRMHTQIVLCPGVNDGENLQRTMEDVSSLFPSVASIAVVPVGMTSFRKNLFPLGLFTPREAGAVIEQVTRFGAKLKKKFATRIVYASDEFYVKAKVDFPRPSFYEDFPQIENGVGMVADFLNNAARTRLPARIAPSKVTLVTGISFGKILKEATAGLRKIPGLTLSQITVKNNFFGPSVTVAGLLTGRDIAAALKGRKLGALVAIPSEALDDTKSVFLDGMRLEEMEAFLKVRIVPAGSFKDLIALLKREGGV
jgi:putative radical SAM enzyme (TIGR03279 family)